MTRTKSADSPWTPRGSQAALHAEQFSTRIDAARPDLGAQLISLNEHSLSGQYVSIHRIEYDSPVTPAANRAWPLNISDLYTRSTDLVATYSPCDDWPYSPQLYWRANSLNEVPGVLASLNLLVSVQTHLLDTHPRIGIMSRLQSAELLHLALEKSSTGEHSRIDEDTTIDAASGTCCLIWRLRESSVSYIELMPASDFTNVQIANDGRTASSRWELFSEFLEKGVIRRARLHSAFIKRENDIDIAACCCSLVRHDQLPLTT